MRLYEQMIRRTVAFLLPTVLLLASCGQSDNDTEVLDIPENATHCLLQPPLIGVMPFGGGSPATRAAQAIKEEQLSFNVGEELGNIITLGNSPVDEISQTRAFANGTYYRIVIYKLADWNSGTLKIHEQRLCKTGSTGYFADLGDSTEPIYLEKGDYRIFCYSFNKTASSKMGKLADGAATVPLSHGDDFMSSDIISKSITASQYGTSVALGTITLKHRCCRLIGILTAVMFNGTGIAASPAPSLSAVSTFTTAGNWSIKSTSFAATTTQSVAKAFTMTKSGNDYTSTMLVLPLTSKALAANYNFTPNGGKNINVNGKQVTASTTFASGGSYSFTIKAIGAYVITEGVESLKIGSYTWATRNVRWNNTFETNLKIWESGNLRGAGQGTTSSAAPSSDYNSYFNWGRKTPSVNSDYETGSTWKSSQNPCPSGYRIPTKAEFENLIAKKVPQNSRVSINGEIFTINNAYGFYNGNKARGLVLKDGTNVLFLPAAGSRINNGWMNTGIRGHYNSSTPTGSYAYILTFDSSSCYVNFPNDTRSHGRSVRCVK